MPPMSEEDLHALYMWVDEIPLSRPKRNIARDFADGVCIAEVVKHFFPKLVELHNYTAASSITQKVDNWRTLNNRVFRRLHFEVPEEEIRDITAAVPGAIERFLRALQAKIVQIQQKQEEAARSLRNTCTLSWFEKWDDDAAFPVLRYNPFRERPIEAS